MLRIPCEADLASDDDQIWANAFSKCTMAATPQCIEAKACAFEGDCFEPVKVVPGIDKDKSQEQLIIDLQTKIESLEVKHNVLKVVLENKLYATERLYEQSVKKGNETNAFAFNIFKRELKTLINDLNNEPENDKLRRQKHNGHILK